MKRIVLWALSTLSAVVLLLGYHTSTSSTLATGTSTSVVSSASGSSRSSSSGSSSGSSGGGSSSSGSSGSATTVTGEVAQTRWGPVQVRLTMDGSTITAVDVVQQPSGNPRDEEINSYALPVLVQETIDQQSAQIDMVSGATVTSEGYLASLQSALDQAGS